MKRPAVYFIVFSLVALFAFTAYAGQIDIVGPAGSGRFGTQVFVLPNGNIVVSDPSFSLPGISGVGAVYLYDGKTLALISRLTGGTQFDQIGYDSDYGVTVLTNGNFVVHSPTWDNPSGPIENAGAVTWCSGTTGCNGTVSAANSLVGGTSGDFFNADYASREQVFALTNGNYAVSSPKWDNPVGPIADVGAATWGNGEGGTVGSITPQNSLIGGTASDGVSTPLYINKGGIFPLTNGSYVVTTPRWRNPMGVSVGAVTWGSGTGATVGLVKVSNSLVGSTNGDSIGSDIVALTNGNYVVASPHWDNPTGPIVDVGAATWGNGNGGTVGPVSPSNSLIGGTTGDQVSYHYNDDSGGIIALTNGNYIVATTEWDGPGATNAGAVTWGNGTGGTVGVVTSSNSLVGGFGSGRVGKGLLTALTNGNYVVASPEWATQAGAVTWGNGSSGTIGIVSASNSLVGTNSGNRVGDGQTAALSNGNYVVSSPRWDGPGGPNVGAATWGNGAGGTVGAVTTSNSLVGPTQNDLVGERIFALTNGNYVVGSPDWDNRPGEAIAAFGAATWGNGNGGTVGSVTPANSLVGVTQGERVGFYCSPLTNGNYVVLVPYWTNPSGQQGVAGAVTWCSGTTGCSGTISATNSLVGTTAGDAVGSGNFLALPNGNYVVGSPSFHVPSSSPTPAPSPTPVPSNYGAVTYALGTGATTGPVIGANSVFGSEAYDIRDFVYDQLRNRVVIGRTISNRVSILIPPKAPFDFDGDGKTDISIYRPGLGQWWISKSSGGNFAATFGGSSDRITPGDFTGDGKTDIAFWRPSSGEWFVLRSEDNSYYSFPFGTSGDIPTVGDFDGDNKSDAAIFRPSNATWYIKRSSGGTTIQQFGLNGDVPVPADYDGDGRADIAIFRPADGKWWIQRSTAGVIAYQFGSSSDKPVPGDYTGDGKADVAFWRPSTGDWFILRSENSSFYSFPFGVSTDIAAPGDYDGDAKFDAGVFRSSNARWYVNRSTAGTLIQIFGQNGDRPVPNAFVP